MSAETRAGDRPKVGISGSFGRGNLGDELFVKVHEHYLGAVADLFLVTNLPHPYYLKPFGTRLIDMMDSIVIGGGDLICPYRTKMDQDFSSSMYLRRPVHMVGIGVEQNKPDQLERNMQVWKEFLNHKNMKYVSARDPASAAWVEEYIYRDRKVPHHPDIVLSLPLPEVKRRTRKPIVGLVTRSITHPRDMEGMKKAADYLKSQGWQVRHIIFGVGRHGQEEFDKSEKLVVEGKETFYSQNIDKVCRAIGECSLILSMKLHSTIVGTMYGIPSLTFFTSGKIREFMRQIGREDLVFSANDPEALELIKAGIPDLDMDRVRAIQTEASNVMRDLAARVSETVK